ncbi:sensor histidine kinase [Frateuria sp. STR12]|uniref:sensor histidine kinase n=1 Tax=Frateuria hangzhouensis TaxID=2995589 RepID=UPI002260C032|nr:histidine kinase [Frateuria sp. STR12]MCX7514480.1 histidine kinase [Frateuria sp. STR12]
MRTSPTPVARHWLVLMLGWRRLLLGLGVAAMLGLLQSTWCPMPTVPLVGRAMIVGLAALIGFGLFERWPARLPRWLARWVLQVWGVAMAVPLAALGLYLLDGPGSGMPWLDPDKCGFVAMALLGLLLGPWIAVAALFRQRDDAVRAQALAFELQRSELERRAADARLRLLQAQVEPHFLFNTLANVRELVEAGSPQASQVLDSLIVYLRAAVPRLQQAATTLGQEMELVRVYLEVMHMRMPDRLHFSLQAEQAALALRCPPMTLLTLVENAVRHGVDPSEEGGRIEVRACVREGRCRAEVVDTGIGLQASSRGLGTGLSTLRERLQLAFGGDAQVTLAGLEPHGVCAGVDFPAQAVVA